MAEITGYKTTVWDIPNHDCLLDTIDYVDQAISENALLSRRKRIYKFFQRPLLISRSHPYTMRLFKSNSAIVQETLRHLQEAASTIHPFSMFRYYCEAVLMIYYLIYFTTVPFFLAFTANRMKDYVDPKIDIVQCNNMLMCTILFGYFEIIVHFFSGYMTNDGRWIVLSKCGIARHYLKTFFIPDLMGAFPGGMLIRYGALDAKYKWVQYICLIKGLRLISFLQYYKLLCKRLQIGFVIQRPILLLSLMFLYLHWAACSFILVTLLVHSIDEEATDLRPGHRSWAQVIEVHKLSAEEIWRQCVLRASSYTFGTTTPYIFSQIHDLTINIVVFLLGMILGAICAVQMALIARSVKVGSQLFENRQSQLNSYLSYKRVPRNLQQRISQYFRFRFENTFYDEPTIMQFLPNHLCQEVYLYKSLRLIETVEMFKDLPPALAIRLVSSTREQVALRNEVLLASGAPLRTMFYILTGTIAIFDVSGNEVCHLMEGAHFGEAALVVEEALADMSAVALETTRLWTVSRRAFRRALASDRKILHDIQDKFRHRLQLRESDREAPKIEKIEELVKHLRDTQRAAEEKKRIRMEQDENQSSMIEHDA